MQCSHLGTRSVWSLVAIAILHRTAAAGLPHPQTWKTVSDDNRYVFVMLSPLSFEEETSPSWYTKADVERSRDIREQYAKSGLYSNDGSTQPLWEYDGVWLGPLIIAPDGDHLIIPGDWINDEYSTRAVTFLWRGTLVRDYFNSDIIPQWTLKAILNGWSPPTCGGAWFDPERMTYTIRTNQHEEIVFDVTNGAIIEVRSPFPTFFTISGLVLGACGAPIASRLWKRMRRNAA